LIGVVGVLLLIAVPGLLWILFLAAFYGAADDVYRRLWVLLPILMLLGGFAAAIGFTNWSWRQIARSWWSWLCVAAIAGLIGFAFFGIDSVRPLRDLAERTLALPGSTLLSEYSVPETGGFDGPTPAHLTRAYSTIATWEVIEDFYRGELARRGWRDNGRRNTTQGIPEVHEWSKSGILFQVHFPVRPESSWAYAVYLWGRP
jgi:hypothetical protein